MAWLNNAIRIKMSDSLDDSEAYDIEFKASHIRSDSDVIGGAISIDQQAIIFEPNGIAKSAGESALLIPLHKIKKLNKSKAGRGIIYSLTGGMLAGHLHIKLDNGTEHVFTVSSVDEKVRKIKSLVQSANKPNPVEQDTNDEEDSNEANITGNEGTVDREARYCSSCGSEISEDVNFCPDCGTELNEGVSKHDVDASSKESNESTPRFPIISVFISLMLFRTATVALEISGGTPVLEFLMFSTLAILIIPRVRTHIGGSISRNLGINLRRLIWSIPVGLVYSLLLLISMFLLIGEGGAVGFVSILMAFILSAVIVYSVRIVGWIRD